MTDYRNALPLGTRLSHGRYVLEDVLGEGGFGVVYRARHGDLGTLYAIKEYLPVEVAVRDGGTVYPRSSESAGDYEDGLRRFVSEAKHLVRFEGHPNIVRCTDFFRENGTAYLVMAYEEGASLDKVLARREARGEPLEEREVLAILRPLLNGLARVHAEDMLHRDIKPANVYIRRHDEQPVLLDFGAAKQEFSHYSKSKAQAYTEGYAPPEQIEHDGKLGAWTDLYAVGALMWRMATGEHPPDAMKKRVLASSRGRSDPMSIDAATGNGRFSAGYLTLMRQCLELDETRRVQSVADALVWLDGELGVPRSQPTREEDSQQGDGSSPKPESPPKGGLPPASSPSWKKPGRIGRWVIGVLALLVLSGGSYVLLMSHGSEITPAHVTLKRAESLAADSVMIMGQGLIPDDGFSLPPGRYMARVKGDGWDDFDNEPCWVGELDVKESMVLGPETYQGWVLEEACLIAFEEADIPVRSLKIGGNDIRISWHRAGNEACNYSGSLAFINGKRSSISSPGPVDTSGAGDWYHECRGGLDSFFEPGGNHGGGAGGDVSVCMDGDRAVAIYSEYYRSYEVFHETFVSELRQGESGVNAVLLGRVATEISEDELGKLVRCERGVCTCNAIDWLDQQKIRYTRATDLIADLLPPAPYGKPEILATERVRDFFLDFGDPPGGIRIQRWGMLARVWGHSHGDLWLVFDRLADAYTVFWVESEGYHQTGEKTGELKFNLANEGRSRYHLKKEDWRSSELSMTCVNEACRLFDGWRLELSSEFPKSAVEYSSEHSGAGIYGHVIDAQLTWQPWLRVPLAEAYLKPVLEAGKVGGGLPKIELIISRDAQCNDDRQAEEYLKIVGERLNDFSSVADPDWIVTWKIHIERAADNGACVITPSFPGNPYLDESMRSRWARFKTVPVRAAVHLWQAVQASTANLVVERDADGEVVRVDRLNERAKAIRNALDRQVSSSLIDNPACVDTFREVSVWRVTPEHSVVVLPPGGSLLPEAPFVWTALSTPSVMVDVRRIDWSHLAYFQPDSGGWRFHVWDMNTHKGSSGVRIDYLPDAWCLTDVASRTVLVRPMDCPECRPERQQW